MGTAVGASESGSAAYMLRVDRQCAKTSEPHVPNAAPLAHSADAMVGCAGGCGQD